MKTIKSLLTALFVIALTMNVQAQAQGQTQAQSQVQVQNQDQVQHLEHHPEQHQVAANDRSAMMTTTTDTLKVLGNCSMCKARIEKAALEAGADKAAWDAKTQKLVVAYDPSKTDTDSLSKKLASVGHDTEKYKAPDDVYEKLPACCHYERCK